MELQIRDVSKTYANGVHALKNVTLTIPAGRYGLLGPNGAGKSTPNVKVYGSVYSAETSQLLAAIATIGAHVLT